MISSYKEGLDGMTYILGSKCSDGVALIGDRKITLDGGATHEYEDKLFMVAPWMVVGSSGVSGLFEKFRDRLTEYIRSPNYEPTFNSLTIKIESITRELNTTYRDILQGQVFDVLLGVNATASTVLQYVHPFGFAEGVRRYKAIGHGEPYGSFFLKQWWRADMKMLDIAELGLFIIKYIEDFELDNTVGIGDGFPQVWLIPDKHILTSPKETTNQAAPPDLYTLSPMDMSSVLARVELRLANFKRGSWGKLLVDDNRPKKGTG
jgi:20S proteasome alpha/beta subunit